MNCAETRAREANRVTWIGSVVNLILVIFKLAAGIFGHSAAMVADGIHSLSDFVTDIVVLFCFKITSKPADGNHDYGHGKYETLAAALVGSALLAAGAGILWSGGQNVLDTWRNNTRLERPGLVALVAAVVSVIFKEGLFHYTMKTARAINSQAVKANAWHHRSDALSSLGTTLGIGGAMLLGEEWRILDPLAAVIVSIFIIKVALSIFSDAVRVLLEESLSPELKEELLSMASAVPGVNEPHNLRTRRVGATVSLELHIRVDKSLTVKEGHEAATEVETALKNKLGQETLVTVHVEPLREAPLP